MPKDVIQIGCKGRHFFADRQILYLKSYVGTVVERLIALHAALGGLKGTDVQRIVGELPGEGCLRGLEGGAEEGVAVGSQDDLLGLEVEGEDADMLLGDGCAVDDGVLDILLLVHDAYHVGDDGLAGGVVGEEGFGVGAAADDVGTAGCEDGFVGLGVVEELAVDHAEAVANHPYLAAQAAEDDGGGGQPVGGRGDVRLAVLPEAGEEVAAVCLGHGGGEAGAAAVAGDVGRHGGDVPGYEAHGMAAVAVGAAVAAGALRRGAVDDGDEVICCDDAVLAFPVGVFRDDGLFDDLHGCCLYTRRSTAAGPPSRAGSWR